ncbi:hypothetical protein EJ110_NYTH23815 [Nymphaea thermarum]|nr:hypothetical protein EJ110_NYTH23815 [Nymphaea thermarum]
MMSRKRKTKLFWGQQVKLFWEQLCQQPPSRPVPASFHRPSNSSHLVCRSDHPARDLQNNLLSNIFSILNPPTNVSLR